jgi:hypothetical protein
MFGGFPKFFDRSFFIGYFLPAFLIFVGFMANMFNFDYVGQKLADVLAEKSTLGATLSLVIIWILSILLMSFNRPLIRLLEGYGNSNPLRIFLARQQEEFKAKAEPHLQAVNNVLGARRRGIQESETFSELSVWYAVRDFPEELDLVLPTRLGNVMRAYERYPDVVYGIEAIALWPRLFMIIPEESRERIRESEGLFIFCVNMLLGSFLILITSTVMLIMSYYYQGLAGLTNGLSWATMAVLISAVFFAWYSWWVLPDAARQRGEQVKSTFDIYRGQLAEALGFDLPKTEAEERRMWRLVSRRMLLRVSEDRLSGYPKSLDDFREKDDSSASNSNISARNQRVNNEEAEGMNQHEYRK